VDPVNPIDVEGGQITVYSLSHPTPSVTTTIANAMLVTAHTFTTATTWSPPAGMTEGFDVANLSFPVDGGQSIEANWATQAAAGATGAKTATAAGTTNMQDWGNAHILALRPGAPPEPKLHFIHTDHLNTPRLIVNDVGQAVWTWNNDDPFGANVPNENPSGAGTFTCNLRLPGQYFDKETNLHYNYFRDYAADIGRYWQSDPIGLGGGVNTYAYVLGNPLSRIDPLGLADGDVFGGGGRRAPFGWPDVSRQAQRDLARQLHEVWSNIFNESGAGEKKEQAIKKCVETICDPAYDRGRAWCEAQWKMVGRQAEKYRTCMNDVRAEYLKCIDQCKKDCQ
jgi:RHS repeat-associated protein